MDILPDNVFLEIFDLYLHDTTTNPSPQRKAQRQSNWQTLVHVCQRWRRIVFSSPRQLNLHLRCSNKTPVLKNLAFWPATLPLILNYSFLNHVSRDEDNIAAALLHSTRIQRISIFGKDPLIKKVATVMRQSFPALTHLYLGQNHDPSTFPVLPRRLLGGSAPCLQHLRFKSVAFPRLPTFLLSARNLVTLQLKDIPQKGYISPEAMTGSLAVLTRLTTLSILFNDDTFTSDPQANRTDPPIQVILPALSEFHYRGGSQYLENFLAQVDTPRLNHLKIEYATDGIEALQLSLFIERTENLKLDKFAHAKVIFYEDYSYVELGSLHGKGSQAHLSLQFCYQQYITLQVPCMASVLGQLAGQLAVFPDTADLSTRGIHVMGPKDMDITQWRPFFRLFPTVQTLRISGAVKTSILSALEESIHTQGTVTDHVFPALRLIWLAEDGDKDEAEEEDEEETPVGAIGRFLSLRQLAGHRVTVVNTEDEFVEAKVEAQLERSS